MKSRTIKIILTYLIFSQITMAQSLKILTNHIGYEKDGPKNAVVVGRDIDYAYEFRVIDNNTKQEVFSGRAARQVYVEKWKNWVFWALDFSPVNKEGTYVIECATNMGIARSYPLVIQKNILEKNTLSNVIYYFKGQRCSGLLNKADRKLKFDGLKDSVNAQGGWYDATGDYGKHLSHLSFSTYFNPQQAPFTVWSLFKTFEALSKRNESNFNQYNRRLLDEAMYGADYLVRVKNPTGSFYRTVAGRGPEKKPEDRVIGKEGKGFTIKTSETKDKFYKGDSTIIAGKTVYEVGYRAGGGLSIAALALAGSYHVSGDFSNADYLKAAESAFVYLEKNNLKYTNDGKENIIDDYCALLAAVELYKTTKKAIYKEAADKRAKNLMGRLISSGKYQNYWRADDTDRPFFHAADAGMPVVSLLNYYEIADGPIRDQVLETVKKSISFEIAITEEVANPFGYARQLVQNKTGDRRSAFFFPHDTEAAPWWQGENARLSSLASASRLAAKYLKDDKAFYDKLQSYAWNQLNWILGLNPFDCCMLQSSGRNNPFYMFFDSYEYTNAPGGICNGITAGYNNPDDIDFNISYAVTGKDEDWRWTEQWLPHASWYLYAVSLKD
jgi:hypothetical protein